MDTLLLQAEQQGSSLLSSSQKQPEKASKSGGDAALNMKRAPVNLEPIILVPQAPSAVITKWNIKKLLEDGEYVTREQQKASGYKPEERISVMHQVPRPPPVRVKRARKRSGARTCTVRPTSLRERVWFPVGQSLHELGSQLLWQGQWLCPVWGAMARATQVPLARGQHQRAARRQCQERVGSTSVRSAGVSACLALVCELCSATVATTAASRG